MFPQGWGLQLWAVIRQQGSINPSHSQSISLGARAASLLQLAHSSPPRGMGRSSKVQEDQGTGYKAVEGKIWLLHLCASRPCQD